MVLGIASPLAPLREAAVRPLSQLAEVVGESIKQVEIPLFNGYGVHTSLK
jgi:hypothetical protein